MDEAPKIYNGSCDITMLLSGTVCRPYAGTSYGRPVYQITNLCVHPLWRYERWRKTQKFEWFEG